MFENLSDKLDRAFKLIKGQGRITEINVAESLKEVRKALLDADVNFKVAKQFTDTVKEKALGQQVLTAVSPGQLMIKIAHDELAQLMGGAVGVDSRPGDGSTFWAELPLPSALAPFEPEAGEARELQQLHGARVLMVEDNPVNMMIAVAMLESWGVVVEQASDGRAAVDAIERAEADGRGFDAVLMDVQMPVMSGHEAARELRQRYSAAQLPIIALTAAALVSERDEALAAGMDAFLTKPIDAPQLRQTLARHARPRAAHSH